MNLLPGTERHLQTNKPKRESMPILPRGTHFTNGQTSHIDTSNGLNALIDLALQLPISHISIDCKYTYPKAPVTLPNGYDKYDISTIKPTQLCLTLCTSDTVSMELHTFIINLESNVEISHLQALFDLPVIFTAYNANSVLHCLWRLGLKEPHQIWDILIAEKARYLGRVDLS